MSFHLRVCRIAAFLARLLVVLAVTVVRADPVITEFMASNLKTLADSDGEFSDWLEIYNPDATAVNLAGWFLTDDAKDKKQWMFPAVTLQPRAYLVVFASTKDRRDPAKQLHTNFRLDADGEYLALIKPDGVTAATEFAPAFPAQLDDVSYGAVQPPVTGAAPMNFLQTATPGAQNSAARIVPPAETVKFSRAPGPFTATFTLELSGAAPGQSIRYVIVAPSAAGAAAPALTASSLKYTAPLAISTSVVVKAAVFAANDAAQGDATSTHFVKIGGAGAAELLNFSSVMPVLILDNHGAGPWKKDNIDHPGWLYRYPSKGRGTPALAGAPDVATPADGTVHGSSSTEFPKKSIGLDLRDPTGKRTELPLVGAVPAKNWTLITPWYFDPSYIKNSFVYALSLRLGHWAPATQPVEVFFHTSGDLGAADYAGIYLLSEKIEIDAKKVNLKSLTTDTSASADISGGYIIKLDEPDPDEYSWTTKRDVPGGASAVVVASAKAADLTTAQKDYIRTYVQQMEDTLYAEFQGGFATRAYLDFIDRASWVDFHLIHVFAGNYDAFERSAYYSKDRGGRIVAGPLWDFDRAFGSATFDETMPWDSWSHPTHINFWQTGWWGYITRDPEFMQDWVDRWQSIRQGAFSNASLIALADSLSAVIGPEAAARDTVRWPMDNPAYAKGVTSGLPSMKAWFTSRVAWIDGQFVAAPVRSDAGASITFTPAAGAQLAYTLDGSDPRSLGGRVAPNALLTSAPLTVSATANIHARSYRADREGMFPGTPWSLAVGGASSSPLFPVARLVNLSARALVGTGENALIAGVVTSDTAKKSYLVRGVGPTLAALGVGNVLPDPELIIQRADGVEIYKNAGWQNDPGAAGMPGLFRSLGAFPLEAGSRDSALLPTLPAGNYTIRVSSPQGRTGVGLAELYEIGTGGRTGNLSARANVQAGEGSLTGGLVIAGPAYKRILVRGVGPTLRALGVTNALADPILTVYSGQTVVATNDAWSTGSGGAALTAATAAVGAFALTSGSEDAALLITLAPGAYTLEVKGKGTATGVALLEIYEVP